MDVLNEEHDTVRVGRKDLARRDVDWRSHARPRSYPRRRRVAGCGARDRLVADYDACVPACDLVGDNARDRHGSDL